MKKNTLPILRQGSEAKFIVSAADVALTDMDFAVILSWGIPQQSVTIDKDDMIESDDGWAFVFDTSEMSGRITAALVWQEPDTDFDDDEWQHKDVRPLCFIATTALAKYMACPCSYSADITYTFVGTTPTTAATLATVAAGQEKKFVIGITDADEEDLNLSLTLSWGIPQQSVTLTEEDGLYQDEDDNWYFNVDTTDMSGVVTATLEYDTEDEDFEDGVRTRKDVQPLLFVATTACNQLAPCTDLVTGDVTYTATDDTEIRFYYYMLADCDGNIFETSDGMVLYVLRGEECPYEHVTVRVTDTNGDGIETVTVTVTADDTSTEYTTDEDGAAEFDIPLDTEYEVEIVMPTGYYNNSQSSYTYTAAQAQRVIEVEGSELEMLIVTDDAEYTKGEWAAAIEAGELTTDDAVALHLSQADLDSNGGDFYIDIDSVRSMVLPTEDNWTQFAQLVTTLPTDGNDSTADYYYDGYTATTLMQEFQNAYIAWRAGQMSLTVGDDTLECFIPSCGQYAFLFEYLTEISDMLAELRPDGLYDLSDYTMFLWASAQADTYSAYIYNIATGTISTAFKPEGESQYSFFPMYHKS